MSEERPPYGKQQPTEDIIKDVQYEIIQKIRNYYNGHYNIDGRPPSKGDFNDYLDSLNKYID